MNKVEIKALSVNTAWNGRRFKSDAYKSYESILPLLLPYVEIPDTGKLQVHYIFGVSSKLFDYDNGIKQFQDVISKYYDFNDNRIYKAVIEKVDVKKGEEYIKFDIKGL